MVYAEVVMIIREYYQNINCHKPKDYFERWYADVWARRIAKKTAGPGILGPILDEELACINARIESQDKGYRYKVTYQNEQEYMMFVLRWSS